VNRCDLVWLCAATVLPAAVICWAAAWGVRRWGPELGWVDRPGPRKIHTAPMPTAGGLAIWLGIVAPLAAGQIVLWLVLTLPQAGAWHNALPAWVAVHLPGLGHQSSKLWLLLAGATAVMLLGLWDDRRALSWQVKLAAQTLIALATVAAGFRMTLFVDWPLLTGTLSVLWIVGLVNSFNMLDNMDGLSAGVAAIAAAILAMAMLAGPEPAGVAPQLFVGGFLLVLMGALLGFLWHNWAPARLFMGNAGSYLVGYLVATAALAATFSGGSVPRHAILAPLCVLAVPLYDTISVVAIRLRAGRSPFLGDESHFSHRLVELGMTKPQAVSTIYLTTATCGLGALLLRQVDRLGAGVILVLVLAILVLVGVLETAGRRRR